MTDFNLEDALMERKDTLLPQAARDTVFHEACTDLGNARRLLLYHGRDILFHFKRGVWLVWDGSRWAEDEAGKLMMEKAEDTVKRIYEEAARASSEEARTSLAKHAVRSESRNKIDAMLALAQRFQPVEPEELDTNPFLFNVENGTINLKTGKLQAHTREDKITMIAPVKYESSADCPIFLEFLDKIMDGNKGLVAYLQRYFGYCLTGDTSEQDLNIAYGSGANGKTTLTNIIKQVLGPYAKTAEFSSFLSGREGTRDDLASLAGSRFVSAIEAKEGRTLDEAVIKQLTGGDPITARHLYGRYFTYTPTFKIWLAANHKPRVSDDTFSMWRRVRLIPFNVTISEKEQDRELPRKLKKELPGILAWAVKGCMKWQRGGLRVPSEVRAATEEYRGEQDLIQQFLEECTDRGEGKVRAGKLYGAYQKWAEKNGMHYFSNFRFSRKLAEKGIKKGVEGANRTFYYEISQRWGDDD